jgi:MFS family permease
VATAVSQYLDDVRNNLRLDLASETEVIRELQTHIEDKLAEMKATGLSEEEAAKVCLGVFGSAKLVARQIYEAHSQGSWQQALMASMPHFLFALLFALNWWQGIGWLAVTLGLILSTAIYGWWRGRPVWLFPWLGYSLIPVIVAGVLLIYLPAGWSWLAIVVYIPLALWLICFVAIQTIKRDWLYIALTLLPIPIIIGWFLAVAEEGQLLVLSLDQIQQSARWIGLSFLALGATVAAFVRLRQRWLKVILLVVSGFLTLIMVAGYAGGRLSLPAFLVLNLVMSGLLLAPALLERRLRRSRGRPTTQEATRSGDSDAESGHPG